MDRLVARLREIAADFEHSRQPRRVELAASFRGHADRLERDGRRDPGFIETTDY
jgi:hypothetical protein